MARKLILIRHGQVEGRYKGKLVGSTDVELSPEGFAQAAGLKEFLNNKSPDVFCSSPLRRCVDTARAAMEGLDGEVCDLMLDALLREADFGEWEGLGFDEVLKRDPAGAARWIECDPGLSFPGGESLGGFVERVDAAADMLRNVDAGTVAAFTHGGVIRFMLCRLLGLEISKHVVFEVGYAAAFVLKLYGDSAMLTEIVKSKGVWPTGEKRGYSE